MFLILSFPLAPNDIHRFRQSALGRGAKVMKTRQTFAQQHSNHILKHHHKLQQQRFCRQSRTELKTRRCDIIVAVLLILLVFIRLATQSAFTVERRQSRADSGVPGAPLSG